MQHCSSCRHFITGAERSKPDSPAPAAPATPALAPAEAAASGKGAPEGIEDAKKGQKHRRNRSLGSLGAILPFKGRSKDDKGKVSSDACMAAPERAVRTVGYCNLRSLPQAL